MGSAASGSTIVAAYATASVTVTGGNGASYTYSASGQPGKRSPRRT